MAAAAAEVAAAFPRLATPEVTAVWLFQWGPLQDLVLLNGVLTWGTVSVPLADVVCAKDSLVACVEDSPVLLVQ
jgi:hypothetical protein